MSGRRYLLIGLSIFAFTGLASAQQFTRMESAQPSLDYNHSFAANWIDFDCDGDLDLFVANGFYFTGIANYLYRNTGEGTFTKVVKDDIVEVKMSALGSSWGDYNDDGWPDLVVANSHGHNNSFYSNDGDGTFTHITDWILTQEGGYSNVPTWADYDNDGDLDIYIGNAAGDQKNFLYRNDNGEFTKDIYNLLATEVTPTNCISWADFDNDGDQDMLMTNIGMSPNQLYINDGSGNFMADPHNNFVGAIGESIGISWGDYDNDCDLDVFITNSAYTGLLIDNFLYRNNGDGTFTEITEGPMVTDGGWSWGSGWGDYDNDGDLDLVVANCVWNNSAPSYNFLYENDGNGGFSKVTDEPVVLDEGRYDAVAWGDYDNDGDLDLFFTTENADECNMLYRNNGNSNYWLKIKCVGVYSNRLGIGVKVRIKATIGSMPVWQMREISSQTGWCGQNEMIAHFGLGDAAVVDTLILEWPGGTTKLMTGVNANQFLTVLEKEPGPICGDANADSAINVSDAVYIINYVFTGGEVPDPLGVADVNCDQTVNVSDAVYLINYVFVGGNSPCDPDGDGLPNCLVRQ
jgi:hypothetical protein